MHLKACLLSLIAILLLAATVGAQSRVLRGSVQDSVGNPLPFVTVKEPGTRNSVTADANGIFSIRIAGDSLQLEAYGYIPLHLRIADSGNFVRCRLLPVKGDPGPVIVAANCFAVRRKPVSICGFGWPEGVRGTVVDERKQPLAGANVEVVKGKTVVADTLGHFSLSGAKFPARLRVSYAGFQPVEIQVGKDTTLMVVLKPSTDLPEVVIAGPVCRRRRMRENSVDCAIRVRAKQASPKPQPEPRVYPNPARVVLYLENIEGLRQLELFDMNGKLLRQWIGPFAEPVHRLHLDDLIAGSYLLRLQFNDLRVRTEKVVVL